MVLTEPTTPEPIDILATNIRGMGATRLVESLLPSLERVADARIACIWLPDAGPLAEYGMGNNPGRYFQYRRFLPNALSRVLECTLLSGRLGRDRSVLVLGDLPIRVVRKQVVFVHTPFLIGGSSGSSLYPRLKARLLRAIFRSNLASTGAVIVQTDAMRTQLLGVYPELSGRIFVVGQPAPQWLLGAPRREIVQRDGGLRLFYPAAGYSHKNHALIREMAAELDPRGPIETIRVTVDQPGGEEKSSSLQYLGQLDPEQMVREYLACDALLFPSLDESYGLPLVEAMYLGLPIVVADKPYAHALCGDGAIYFDPNSSQSMLAAIEQLAAELASGWRPDWSSQLAGMPRNWDEVAEQMLAVVDAVDGTTNAVKSA